MLFTGVFAFQNTVEISFVPPNECVFWATIGVGGKQDLVSTLLNFSTQATTEIPQKVISASATAVSVNQYTVSEFVYVFYQSKLRRVDGLLSAAPQMQLAGDDIINDVAVLVSRSRSGVHKSPLATFLTPRSFQHNFYGTTRFYLGAVPESVEAHVHNLGTVPLKSAATSGASIAAQITNGTHLLLVNFSLAHWWSINPVCGLWSLVDAPNVRIFLAACNESTFNASVPTILSLRELGIGVHVTKSNVTLFRPANDESDHITSIFVVVSMLIFAWAWFRWTRDLYSTVGHPWCVPLAAPCLPPASSLSCNPSPFLYNRRFMPPRGHQVQKAHLAKDIGPVHAVCVRRLADGSVAKHVGPGAAVARSVQPRDHRHHRHESTQDLYPVLLQRVYAPGGYHRPHHRGVRQRQVGPRRKVGRVGLLVFVEHDRGQAQPPPSAGRLFGRACGGVRHIDPLLDQHGGKSELGASCRHQRDRRAGVLVELEQNPPKTQAALLVPRHDGRRAADLLGHLRQGETRSRPAPLCPIASLTVPDPPPRSSS